MWLWNVGDTMAEYTNNAVQTVNPNQVVTLNTTIGCNKGYIYHREGSGIVTLRGITSNCFARYQVTFNGNIAAVTTADPISIALAIDGEPVMTSSAIVTPAAVEDYFNVTSTAIISVPKGCCLNVSVENISDQAITVQNANLTISRIA